MEMALAVWNFYTLLTGNLEPKGFFKRAFISCLYSRVSSKGHDLLTVNISRHRYMEKTPDDNFLI